MPGFFEGPSQEPGPAQCRGGGFLRPPLGERAWGLGETSSAAGARPTHGKGYQKGLKREPAPHSERQRGLSPAAQEHRGIASASGEREAGRHAKQDKSRTLPPSLKGCLLQICSSPTFSTLYIPLTVGRLQSAPNLALGSRTRSEITVFCCTASESFSFGWRKEHNGPF